MGSVASYCDSIREWNRDIEAGTGVKLTESRLQSDLVHCEISLDNKTRAHGKLDEIFNVKNCLGGVR